MASQYHSLFTTQGLELLREAIQNGTKLGITHMSYGDGNGMLPIPDASYTKMVHEVFRTPLNRLAPSKENSNWLEADGIIPSAVGGFNIREVGLWAGNVMVAYANYPPTYKPSADQGTAQIKTIRIVLQIDNTANFELKIDASVVMATIQSVEDAKTEAIEHADLTKVSHVDSLESLMNLEKKWDGLSIFLKSYYAGLNKGGDLFVYKEGLSNINNGVTIFNGWVRQKQNVNIYDGGIKADGSDETLKFQNYYNYCISKGIEIDLLNQAINVTKLDLDSNSIIKNGTLDFRGYTGGDGGHSIDNWRRKPIMLKNNNRNLTVDFELKTEYEKLVKTQNIKFQHVTFLSNFGVFLAYKVENLIFDSCNFYWNEKDNITIIGGINGTVYSSDSETEFKLIDPINGRNKNIQVLNCKAESEWTEYSSTLLHCVACEDVLVSSNKFLNVPLAIRIDTCNFNIRVLNNEIQFNSKAYFDYVKNNDTSDSDFIGVYVGQNSYNYQIANNKMKDVVRPVYIEGASQVSVLNNIFECNFGQKSDLLGIVVQANLRDPLNLYYANCADIDIKGNTIKGYGYPIVVSSAIQANILNKNINIIDNTLHTNSMLSAIVVSKTVNCSIKSNVCTGNIHLSSNKNVYIDNNSIFNESNYAIFISNKLLDHYFLNNNNITVKSGHTFYVSDEVLMDKKIYVNGGSINQDKSYDYVNGKRIIEASNFSTSDALTLVADKPVNLANGATIVHTYPLIGIKKGWSASIIQEAIDEYYNQYGISLDFVVSTNKDLIVIRIKNISNKDVSFTPHFFVTVKPIINAFLN